MTMEELFCMLRDMEMDDRFYCRPVVRRVAMHPDTLREVSFSPVVNLGVLDFVNGVRIFTSECIQPGKVYRIPDDKQDSDAAAIFGNAPQRLTT